MPEKSQVGHVGVCDDPLPPPLTTRNLRPRLSTSRARTVSRDASIFQQASRSSTTSRRSLHQHSAAAPTTHTMQSSAGSSSTSSKAGSSSGNQGSGSTRVLKKRRTRSAMTQPDWSSGEESEDVDQLISEEDSPYISRSMAGPSTSRVPGSSLPTAAVAAASTSTQTSEATHTSSPSPTHRASASASTTISEHPSRPRPPEVEPLAEYTCPICFFPPTNATLTPCGHICCGACLFTAVKSTIQRGALMRAEMNVARCPVCRADIPGWDGKGGGVIGLKPRAVFSL
ncbi:hypothetical protein FPV67DRAFT_875591 [Lyophyllum atratum]|nr:hypothetical protein FPV67DRAFT_875591 [Lyophyllum atratum]